MAEIIPFSQGDELIPVEEWDGEAWRHLIEDVFDEISRNTGADKYDLLASFMQTLFEEFNTDQ